MTELEGDITVLFEVETATTVEVIEQGLPGASAYEIAAANGFEGTEEEWLESLGGGSTSGVVASVVLYCPTLTAADLTPTDGDTMYWVEHTPSLTHPDPMTGLEDWSGREEFTWTEGWATDNDPTNVLMLTGEDSWLPTVLAEVTPTGFTAIPVLGGQSITLGCGGSPDFSASTWTGWNIGNGLGGGIDPTQAASFVVPSGTTADQVRIVDRTGNGDHTTLDEWYRHVKENSNSYGLASSEIISVVPTGTVLAEFNTGSWDDQGIREPGQSIYDPATGLWIITYSGRRAADGFASVGALWSEDGVNWDPHPQNPIVPVMDVVYWGADMASEDPYIAKTVDGVVWRDSSNRALLFCEEKDGTTQRGINLFRSSPGTLSDWTLVGGGACLPEGATGTWDESDRSSPTVIHDGTQLVMLYEGRGPSQQGQVGIAFSSDEGETWTANADPIIVQVPNSWCSSSVVADDVIKVEDKWVLVGHGYDNASYTVGRWTTTDDPADWTDTSWVEDSANPVASDTSTIMCWGNDPRRVLWLLEADEFHLETGLVYPGLGVATDLTTVQSDIAALQSWNGTLDSRLDTAEGTIITQGLAVESAIDGFAATDLAANAAGHAAANASSGMVEATETWMDIYDLVGPGAGFDALDPTSQLDSTAGSVVVVPTSVTEGIRGALVMPSSPPAPGAELVGVLVSGVTVSGAVPIEHVINFSLTSGGPTVVPSQSFVAGAGWDRWQANPDDGGMQLRAGTAPDPVDIYLSAYEAPLGVTVIMYIDGTDTSDFPSVTIEGLSWVWRTPQRNPLIDCDWAVKRFTDADTDFALDPVGDFAGWEAGGGAAKWGVPTTAGPQRIMFADLIDPTQTGVYTYTPTEGFVRAADANTTSKLNGRLVSSKLYRHHADQSVVGGTLGYITNLVHLWADDPAAAMGTAEWEFSLYADLATTEVFIDGALANANYYVDADIDLTGMKPGFIAIVGNDVNITFPSVAESDGDQWNIAVFGSYTGTTLTVTSPDNLFDILGGSLPEGAVVNVRALADYGIWAVVPQTGTTTALNAPDGTGNLSTAVITVQALMEEVDSLALGSTAVHFDITSYGAVDGSDSTDAIEDAVAAASAAGGGVVLVPPGTYLTRRTIFLPSGVTLAGHGTGSVITKAATVSTTLTTTYNAGTTAIVVTDATGFSVGDHIFISDTTNYEWNGTHAVINTIVGSTITFTAVNSVALVGHSGTRAQYRPDRSATVKTIFPMVSNVPGESGMAIRDLTLDQNYGANDPINEFCVGIVHWVEAYRCLVHNVTLLNAVGDAYSDQANEGYQLDAAYSTGAANIKTTRNAIVNSRILTCQRHATHLGTCMDGAYVINNEMTDVGGRALFYCAYATNAIAMGNLVTNFAEGFSLGDIRDTGAVIANNIFVGGARAADAGTLYCVEPGPEAVVSGNRMLGVKGGIRIPADSADCIVDSNYVHLTGTRECLTILASAHRTKVTNNNFSSAAATGSNMVVVNGGTAGVTDLLFSNNVTEGGYYHWSLTGSTGGVTRCTIRNSPVIGTNGQSGLKLSGLIVDLDLDLTGWNVTGTNIYEDSSPTLTRMKVNGVGYNGASDPASAGGWALNPATASNERHEGVVVHWNDGTDHYSKYLHGTGFVELTGGSSAAHASSHENGGGDELELDASQIVSGTLDIARIATGTPTGSKFVRDDGTLATVPGAAPAAGEWVTISDERLASAGMFTFPSLSTYTDVEILVVGRTVSTLATQDGIRMRLNGDSGNNYTRNNSALTSLFDLGAVGSSLTNADRNGRVLIELSLGGVGNYTIGWATNTYMASTATVGTNISSNALNYINVSAAITSFSLFTSSGLNFAAGARMTVRGRTAP